MQRRGVATPRSHDSKHPRAWLGRALLAAASLPAVGCGASDEEAPSSALPEFPGAGSAAPPAGAGSNATPGGSAEEGATPAPPAADDDVDGEIMSGIANPSGVPAPPGSSGAGGVQVGMQCVPLCASAA